MKRLGSAVEAPWGPLLKMYTPFRRKPRIFPAAVSATVLSEAITLPFPQLVVANALGEASGLRCASVLRDKMAEPANPAPAVAMLRRNERRSLEQGAGCRPGCLSTEPLFLHLNRPPFLIHPPQKPKCRPNWICRGGSTLDVTCPAPATPIVVLGGP